MGSPVQFPRPSPPEETNQTLCVLVYFGRAHEDLGQKVGEWSTDGEERPGCAEVCGGGGVCAAVRAGPRWRSQSDSCCPHTQSSSCLWDCYRNPGSSRSKSQTNNGCEQSLICSLLWQLLTSRLKLLPREGPLVQSPQIHPQATWMSLAPFYPP